MRKYSASLASLLMMLPVVAQSEQAPVISKVKLFKQIHHARSLPLRYLVPPAYKRRQPTIRQLLPHRTVNLNVAPFKTDTAQQLQTTDTLNINLTFSAMGIGIGLGSYLPGVTPPDTTGSVGLTQYVQMVNSQYAVFNKADGSIAQPVLDINNLWTGFGGVCETTNEGDPVVKYDQLANRWVISQFAFNTAGPNKTAPFTQCLAVSTTSDATGAYSLYAFVFDNFNDYGKLGLWPDAYYMTFHMFTGADDFIVSRACALDRENMIAGNNARPAQCFDTSYPTGTFVDILPADLDGYTLPPTNTPEYLLSLNIGDDRLDLWRFKVDFDNDDNSQYSGPFKVSGVMPFTQACAASAACAAQPGTGQGLDVLSDRLMYRLAYRQFAKYGAMLINHTVQASNANAAVRWYQINILNGGLGIARVYQQGTYSPDSAYRWMGSIAMDKNRNIALGYSLSSSTIFPSIAVTGRERRDTRNAMRTETVLATGTGTQTGIDRWGDYTTMSIDPVDDCTFWYTNEYLTTTAVQASWSTRILAFKFPDCV